ncbi:MAG: hypothetical protein AB7T06_01275 [Kofleriaceae bacterium]
MPAPDTDDRERFARLDRVRACRCAPEAAVRGTALVSKLQHVVHEESVLPCSS